MLLASLKRPLHAENQCARHLKVNAFDLLKMFLPADSKCHSRGRMDDLSWLHINDPSGRPLESRILSVLRRSLKLVLKTSLESHQIHCVHIISTFSWSCVLVLIIFSVIHHKLCFWILLICALRSIHDQELQQNIKNVIVISKYSWLIAGFSICNCLSNVSMKHYSMFHSLIPVSYVNTDLPKWCLYVTKWTLSLWSRMELETDHSSNLPSFMVVLFFFKVQEHLPLRCNLLCV